ncbi:MAG: ComEC/Rec2 family competence protein [Patescibacteria group bacterium]
MILFFVLLLLFRFWSDWRLGEKFVLGQKIKLSYCLSDQPFYSKTNQTFYYQNHFSKLKIVVPIDPRFDFGDCLEIIGEIVDCPKSSRTDRCLLNPLISQFNNQKEPRVLAGFLTKKLRFFREKMAESFLGAMPSPESDLLSGIVLGLKQQLGPDFYRQLRLTGTLHIVVASGYNFSLIGERPVNFLAFFLGRLPAVVLGIFLVWLYVGIVGFEPPVIRAAIMLSFLFLAQLAGRKFDRWRVLAATVYLMLFFKPDLIADVSFQLSLTALIGVMLGDSLFGKLKKIPVFGSGLAATLSAQLLVLPVICWHFGATSLIAPLVNALILPLIPWITGIGFVSLAFLWSPFLNKIILLGLYPLLWWSVLVVESLSRVPKAEFSLKINGYQVIFYYLVFFFLFHKLSSKKEQGKQRRKGDGSFSQGSNNSSGQPF